MEMDRLNAQEMSDAYFKTADYLTALKGMLDSAELNPNAFMSRVAYLWTVIRGNRLNQIGDMDLLSAIAIASLFTQSCDKIDPLAWPIDIPAREVDEIIFKYIANIED